MSNLSRKYAKHEEALSEVELSKDLILIAEVRTKGSNSFLIDIGKRWSRKFPKRDVYMLKKPKRTLKSYYNETDSFSHTRYMGQHFLSKFAEREYTNDISRLHRS